MITLKEAINILDLKDEDMVYLSQTRFDDRADFLSVGKIREKYDMRKTKVKKIYRCHWQYEDDTKYELIIVKEI